MNSDIVCARKKRECLGGFLFTFILEYEPLDYFLTHVMHLDDKLEEMEYNQMEVISTHIFKGPGLS
jgi:hypothetical protein